MSDQKHIGPVSLKNAKQIPNKIVLKAVPNTKANQYTNINDLSATA